MSLYAGLLADAALVPPGAVVVEQVVREHRLHRAADYGDLIGPLVVPDTVLTQVGRAAGLEPVDVSVVNTGGAGGLTTLARRAVPGVRVVAVESALRDLDDLAGNAARVVAAAGELDPDVAVYVELPLAPGWVRAVEVVEAAGLFGKINATGGELVEQLSVVVEADLAFTAVLPEDRLLPLVAAVDALVDGTDLAEATALLESDTDRLRTAVVGWDEATIRRVRRRLRLASCRRVVTAATELVSRGPASP